MHVIGAGVMGADIAGWCVAAGMQVSLQDLSPEAIEKGIATPRQSCSSDGSERRQLRAAAKERLIADPDR